ncbi:MAG TPA: gliding motility-associated C-terminal domain-containing protein [Cyclobacteriaceae bacterium]|nr:gliding motility-associated C-terminal domain-containing protein [Cyclobacteriaceae bacterium]
MGDRAFFRIWFALLIFTSSGAYAENDPGIEFRENKGQWDPQILFRAEISNGWVLVTRRGLQYVFLKSGSFKGPHAGEAARAGNTENPNEDISERQAPESNINAVCLAYEFIGKSDRLMVRGEGKKAPYYNYFNGNNPQKWVSHAGSYSEVIYQNLYPGIHFRLYSEHGFMKYDIQVDPGADPSDFRCRYMGVDSLREEYNTLKITTALGNVTENYPVAYQLEGNDTIPVGCRYAMDEEIISFELPEGYDPGKRVIIDPLLVFSSYSGSTMDNWGNTATFDQNGNVYSGGTVRSELGGNLPVTPGAYQTTFGGIWDVAILKFDSTGKDLIYGTYLGGSGTETPLSLIVNNKNELVIFGITGSADYPVTSQAYSRNFSGGDTVTNALGTYNSGYFGVDYLHGSDFFIAILDETGSELISSTYLGGTKKEGINNAPGNPLSRNYGDEFRGEVNVDETDNIYIISNTSSPDFPIVNGFQSIYGGGTHDAVIAKLNPDLSSLTWSTFLGGFGMDAGYGIKITENEYVVVAGGTMSDDFPVTQGSFQPIFGGDVDGFIAEISENGDSLIAGTFCGTMDYDQAYFVDIDADGDVYVFGQTTGDYPVSPGIYSNPNSGQFLHKFSQDLSTSIFSTVIGSGSGIPDISPTAFLVNECENIFLSGWGGRVNQIASKYVGGYTDGLPVTEDAFQSNTDGSDFYLMVLAKDIESLLYGTYLGAVTFDQGEHVDGGTSRFDKRGIVYHAICACRDNSQFPTTPGVWSNVNGALSNDGNPNNEGCNNGVFKFDLSSLNARFTTNTPEFDKEGITKGCFPFEVVFLNRSTGGKTFRWEFGDNSSARVQRDSVYHVYSSPGSYFVILYAIDENTCQKIDVATGRIDVFEEQFAFPKDVTICKGDRIPLQAGGAVHYEWRPSEGLNDPSAAVPLASPDSTTVYHLNMIDKNTCEAEDSVQVIVVPSIHIDIESRLIYDCLSPASLELTNFTTNADTYLWNMGDGHTFGDSSLVYHYADTGSYEVTLHATGGGVCADSASMMVHISELQAPNVITPNSDMHNDHFKVLTDAPVQLRVFNRWGESVYKSDRYLNDWSGSDLSAGVYFYEIKMNEEAICSGWVEILK